MITGWSFFAIESAAILPTPLSPKTVSVMSAPPSRPAKSIPKSVTIGGERGPQRVPAHR